jgi:hypothetical protein
MLLLFKYEAKVVLISSLLLFKEIPYTTHKSIKGDL